MLILVIENYYEEIMKNIEESFLNIETLKYIYYYDVINKISLGKRRTFLKNKGKAFIDKIENNVAKGVYRILFGRGLI